MKRLRRLAVENLERRELMAGNVAISTIGGSVTVTGDAAANDISIYQQPNGRFNIIANDGEVFTGPTTNLIIRNLAVNLGAGDDWARIGKQTDLPFPFEPAQILGTTSVNGGTGANRVFVNVNGREIGTQVVPALAIHVDLSATAANDNSGIQDDALAIVKSSAASIILRTGAGDDSVSLGGVQALNLFMDLGGPTSGGMTDDDYANIYGVVALNATYSMGSGANELLNAAGLYGNVSVTTGNGDDLVAFSSSVVGTSLTINSQGGDDTVNVDEVHAGLTSTTADIFEQFDINLPALPFDLAALLRYVPSLPGFISISSGEGDDEVYAGRLRSTLSIVVSLDGGDDSLIAIDNQALYALYNGGLGTDSKFSGLLEGIASFVLFEEEMPNPFPEWPGLE